MTALNFGSSRRITKDGIVKFLLIFTTLVLPGLLLVAGVIYYYRTAEENRVEEGEFLEVQPAYLLPSTVLEDKYKYRGQELVLRGKVKMAPAVCERKECPKGDPCCGCQDYRDLVIEDAETSWLSESSWVMRILDPDRKSFCLRLPDSCDYQCPDWELDGVYEVNGIFVAVPPPQGSAWSAFIDFYFLTEDRTLVAKHGIWERVLNVVSDLRKSVDKFGKTGSYVLQ
jgi:hypothetical protein